MRFTGIAVVAVSLLAGCGSGSGSQGTPATGGGPDPGGQNQPPIVTPADRDAIARENQLAGTTAWKITQAAQNREIEGYALASSVAAGSAVPIAVSVSTPGSFTWTAYRLGWYGGARGREMARGGPVGASTQPRCPVDPSTSLVSCSWSESFRVETGPTWPSGAYLVKLKRSDGYERYVPFVVRPGRRSELVLVVPTTTWAAYNDWGGSSLYDDATGTGPRTRAYRVSFDRPYVRDLGAGHLLRETQGAIAWLEAQGYDVTYATVEDVDQDPTIFDGASAILISAHDEYWSGAYRTHVDAALAAGTSILNLGANNGYWHVRLEPSADGRLRRIVTCYKGDAARLDPAGPNSPELTVRFRDPPLSRPENALFGIMFNDSWNTWALPAVVTRPDHWLFAGTGLRALDTLPMVHGYEVDEVVGAPPPGLDIAAESTTLTLMGGVGRAQMVVRRQGSAWVFSAGGIGFAEALGADGKADARVGRIVANVLARALGRPSPDPLVDLSTPVHVEGRYASAVRTVATGLQAPIAVALLPRGALAVADTAEGTVRSVSAGGASSVLASGLVRPLGLAADTDGTIYVSDTERSCIRQITTSGAVSVFAGTPWSYGSVDGVGASARFGSPAGLAIRSGVLYVADVGASAVRAVNLATGAVTTVAAAGLYRPTAVAPAADGSLLVVDTGSRRILSVRGGAVTTVAGNPWSQEGYADGAAADARLLPQLGVAVLADGSIAFSDPGSYRVRRVAGGRVTAFAGTGHAGRDDGPGGSADLVLPTGLAVGSDGTLYVADTGNGAIRAITP